MLGDCDDVGGQDAAEDVEVQEIGFISARGVEACVSGVGVSRDNSPYLKSTVAQTCTTQVMASGSSIQLGGTGDTEKISQTHSAMQIVQTELSNSCLQMIESMNMGARSILSFVTSIKSLNFSLPLFHHV